MIVLSFSNSFRHFLALLIYTSTLEFILLLVIICLSRTTSRTPSLCYVRGGFPDLPSGTGRHVWAYGRMGCDWRDTPTRRDVSPGRLRAQAKRFVRNFKPSRAKASGVAAIGRQILAPLAKSTIFALNPSITT